MWIFLSDAFLSIVESDRPDVLLVRARFPRDIQRVFPAYKIQRTPTKDYCYRALVPRDVVAEAMARKVQCIDYPNFKNTVRERERERAYSDVWSRMYLAQLEREGTRRRSPEAAGGRKRSATIAAALEPLSALGGPHFGPQGTSKGKG